MKTIKFLTIIILLIFSACSTPKTPTTNEVYVLVDVTASADNKNHSLNLDKQKIMQLCGLNKDPMSAVKYSHSLITEVHLNQEFRENLKPANPSDYNKYKRLAKIKKFVTKIESAVTKLENSEYDRASSNIFIAIANTINKVIKNDADKQLVIIQSDMLDNSYLFSAYDSGQMARLKKSPKFLIDILGKETPITENLDKMKIIIVHQPNAQTDYSFRLIANIYKKYLQDKGASVQIVGNL